MGERSSWPSTRKSLLWQLRQGSAQDSWNTFVAIYAPLVYRYGRSKGLQDADALDVTQEVMAKVRNFEYDPQRGHFRAWLATVAGHEIARCQKKLNRPDRGIGGDTPNTILEQATAAEDDLDWTRLFKAHILETALQRIQPEFSGQEWQAFTAVALKTEETAQGRQVVWVSDASASKVAQEVKQTVAWVYKVKSKIFKRLRDEVLYLAEDLGVMA